jgi:hypothetical protein
VNGAVVLDRIAVIAGTHAIKVSDIDRDIRLTQFLNREPLKVSPAVRREAAERLITQDIIREEIVMGGYVRPAESQGAELEAELRRDRYANSSEKLREALARYGLTETDLRDRLLWQITVLQFIDQRFRAGVVVTDDEVRQYYDQHATKQSFEEAAPKLKQAIEAERINQSFNDWLDQARKTYRVQFKEAAFQ